MAGYWLLSTPLVLFGVWGLINLVGGKEEDQIKTPLIVFCLIPILMSVIYFFVQLKTDLNEREIVIRFFPLPFFTKEKSIGIKSAKPTYENSIGVSSKQLG